MVLSSEEIENLEKFFKSDDSSLQMMGISMSKNLDLPPRMYSLLSSLSIFSDDEQIRNTASLMVKEKFNFISTKYTTKELVNPSDLKSLAISLILVAEINQVQQLKWQGIHGPSGGKGWETSPVLQANKKELKKSIELSLVKDLLRFDRARYEIQNFNRRSELLIEVIISIIVELANSDFNKLISESISSVLVNKDKKMYEKYLELDHIILNIRDIFPIISNHYWYTDTIRNNENILSKDNRKVLSRLFLVCLISNSDEKNKVIEYLINCLIEPIRDAPIWALVSVKLRDFSYAAVPRVEKLYLENENLHFSVRDPIEKWSSDFLKDFGSGFYRMKNAKLNLELLKRGLKQTGKRREKIMRLSTQVISSGENSIFSGSKYRLKKELLSSEKHKVLEIVEDLAYHPQLLDFLIGLFSDQRDWVRYSALKSVVRLKQSSGTTELLVIKSLKSKLNSKDKMISRGSLKALAASSISRSVAWHWTDSKKIFNSDDSGLKLIFLDIIIKSWTNNNIPKSPHMVIDKRETKDYTYLTKKFKMMMNSDDNKIKDAGQISLLILEKVSIEDPNKIGTFVKDGLGNLTKDLF